MSDALFEFADFEPRPVFTGAAPLNFTRDYYHPDDLVAAHRWLCKTEGNHGSAVGRYHTWNLGITTGWVIAEGQSEHSMCILDCCLSCFDYPVHDIARSRRQGDTLRTCYCVQLSLYQAVCTACRWHHIDDIEQGVVEAWHDHAFPGWRSLPVVPAGVKHSADWAREHYPERWQIPFAPIVTEREGHGLRWVPGRSPWGGYDIAAVAS